MLSLRCCRGSPESQRKSRASPSDGARFGSGPRFSVLDQLDSSGIPEYLCSTSFAKHVAQCNFLTASLKSYCMDGLILSWVTPTFYDYESILSTLRNRRVDQSASQPVVSANGQRIAKDWPCWAMLSCRLRTLCVVAEEQQHPTA